MQAIRASWKEKSLAHRMANFLMHYRDAQLATTEASPSSTNDLSRPAKEVTLVETRSAGMCVEPSSNASELTGVNTREKF